MTLFQLSGALFGSVRSQRRIVHVAGIRSELFASRFSWRVFGENTPFSFGQSRASTPKEMSKICQIRAREIFDSRLLAASFRVEGKSSEDIQGFQSRWHNPQKVVCWHKPLGGCAIYSELPARGLNRGHLAGQPCLGRSPSLQRAPIESARYNGLEKGSMYHLSNSLLRSLQVKDLILLEMVIQNQYLRR